MDTRKWSARIGLVALVAALSLCVFEAVPLSHTVSIPEVDSPVRATVNADVGLASRGRSLSAFNSDTEYDFYGFYGFYGVTAPVTIDCDSLVLKVTLYNYGAKDLTHVNTIRYIIEKTKQAIDATYKDAVPTGSSSNYELSVTEIDGSYVTFITVTAEMNFQAGNLSKKGAREAGGIFGSFLGISADDQSSSGTYEIAAPAPNTGKGSVGMDLVISGFDADEILNHENELISFQTVLQSSVQASVAKAIGETDGVTTQLIGLIQADEDSDAVAARVYVYFDDADAADEYKDLLENDKYSLTWGALDDNKVKVIMTVSTSDATFTDAFDRSIEVRTSERRRLMSAWSAATVDGTIFSKNVAKAGLGVNSLDPTTLVCKIESGTDIGDSDGSSDDDRSKLKPSSALTSSAGSYFYGYNPSPASIPESSSESASFARPSGPKPSFNKPKPPSFKPKPSMPSLSPSPKPTSAPPAVEEDPVYFTTILSDYNMEDLATDEDMAQFKSDYIASVDAAIKLLGITSNPIVSIQDVLPASVAVPTTVTFIDDPSGAQLFKEVLQSNPSLAFPAFSGLGEITIVEVSSEPNFRVDPVDPPVKNKTPTPEKKPVTGPVPPTVVPPTECPVSRSGESCCGPALLDAKSDCCWNGVDECGVCGGKSDTCATAATVRVLVNRPGVTTSTSSAPFEAMVVDFKAGMANLFGAFDVDSSNIVIDSLTVSAQRTANGLEFDVPFRVDPGAGVSAPTLSKARAILVAAAEQKTEADGMTIVAVLDVARAGVCGNNVCEIGEYIGAADHTSAAECPADCPAYIGCPAPNGILCGGHGECASATGMCKCAEGHAGEDCSTCKIGFSLVDGACVASGVRSDRDVPIEANEEDDSNATSIILGVVFGVVALILVGLLGYYIFVIRKRHDASREEGLAFHTQQQVPASNEEPDIPTRQLTEDSV